MRLKRKDEFNQVALTVIYFLGVISFIATISSAYLINQCIIYEDGLNAAAVALVGQMVSISTLSLGALGAMLSSTSPKPPPPPTMDGSTPVTVVNNADDPVPTDPQVEEFIPEPEVEVEPPKKRR